ncbi:hypothetical protein OB905_08410 [Halobacteria archaeon AArc-dxtr1]|nr:hypothetical protein [Halobacteria archaeon AArc-dxtr1]
MLRELLIAFGVIEILVPQPIVDACERIGLENPDAAELRSKALVLARLEGALVVLALVRGREGSPIARGLLTGAGLAALLVPRPLIRFSQHFAYENPTDLQLKPWVVPATRLLGACYLLVAALSTRSTPATDEAV